MRAVNFFHALLTCILLTVLSSTLFYALCSFLTCLFVFKTYFNVRKGFGLAKRVAEMGGGGNKER